MKAHTVFIDGDSRCAVFQSQHNELFVVRLDAVSAVGFADIVSADFANADSERMLNLTQARLFRGTVIERARSLDAAVAVARMGISPQPVGSVATFEPTAAAQG